MALTFCSFSSGSTGNCSLVKSDNTAILVDSGISGRKIFQSLKSVSVDPADVNAVLITHEHTDHISSLRVVNKKLPHIRTYANCGTWDRIEKLVDESKRATFTTGERFGIGDIEIKAFLLSHDAAEPVGYSFYSGGKQLSIITDTGCISEDIYEEIKGADLLILEANHDVEMLKMGRYPYFLKHRILGENGHLSNVDAANAICKIFSEGEKERQIILAHLSKENNFPEMAYLTVKNRLAEMDFYIGAGLRLNIIPRNDMSEIFLV